jgi:predicted lipoprotein with Yx(FWY)xxD motif
VRTTRRGAAGIAAAVPAVDGVSLEGLPLYTSASDSDPGDVTGQGVGGIGWVVAPDGMPVPGC